MSVVYPNTAIVIAGPTASGKTALSLQLAQQFGTAIISADSRQCYHEMTIGVAKPTAVELETVNHYFINSHSVHDKVDAAVFEQVALSAAEEIFTKNSIAIVVGGTGLYLKAFCEGVDAMPPIPDGVKTFVQQGFYKNGLAFVHAQLQQHDPELFHATHELQNPHRMMRALEFVLTTGSSIRAFQKGQPKARPFNIVKIGLALPKDSLYNRIEQRTDTMIAAGLVEEVKALQAVQHLNALQTVGYREIFDYFNGISSLDAAIEFIKRSTKQYAKRQLTWFKKDEGITWFHPNDALNIIDFVSAKL